MTRIILFPFSMNFNFFKFVISLISCNNGNQKISAGKYDWQFCVSELWCLDKRSNVHKDKDINEINMLKAKLSKST